MQTYDQKWLRIDEDYLSEEEGSIQSTDSDDECDESIKQKEIKNQVEMKIEIKEQIFDNEFIFDQDLSPKESGDHFSYPKTGKRI